MARHLVPGTEQRGKGVRMAHLHLVGKQPFVGLFVAVGLLQRNAECDGLDRHAHRRQRDPVIRRVVLDRLDVRIAGDEFERQATDADDGSLRRHWSCPRAAACW